MFQLRQTKDMALVQEMDRKCFPDDKWDNTTNMKWWLLKKDGIPVGYCSCRMIMPDTCYFTRAGILPSARGKGLQKKLINVRVNWARKQGAKYVITYTSMDNFASLVNLIKSGFKMFNPQWAWAGKEFFYFKKDL